MFVRLLEACPVWLEADEFAFCWLILMVVQVICGCFEWFCVELAFLIKLWAELNGK